MTELPDVHVPLEQRFSLCSCCLFVLLTTCDLVGTFFYQSVSSLELTADGEKQQLIAVSTPKTHRKQKKQPLKPSLAPSVASTPRKKPDSPKKIVTWHEDVQENKEKPTSHKREPTSHKRKHTPRHTSDEEDDEREETKKLIRSTTSEETDISALLLLRLRSNEDPMGTMVRNLREKLAFAESEVARLQKEGEAYRRHCQLQMKQFQTQIQSFYQQDIRNKFVITSC